MSSRDDIGKLIIRLAVGILMLFHGVAFLGGDHAILNRVASYGMPEIIGWGGAIFGELVGPILILLGVYSRIGGALVTVFMLTAIALSHNNHLFMLSERGGGYFLELQMFFLLTALSIFVTGAGRYGLGIGGRWN